MTPSAAIRGRLTNQAGWSRRPAIVPGRVTAWTIRLTPALRAGADQPGGSTGTHHASPSCPGAGAAAASASSSSAVICDHAAWNGMSLTMATRVSPRETPHRPLVRRAAGAARPGSTLAAVTRSRGGPEAG